MCRDYCMKAAALSALACFLAALNVAVLDRSKPNCRTALRSHTTGQQKEAVQLYVGVISQSANRAKRMAIRRTWGSDPRLSRVVFVVSKPSSNSSLLSNTRQEALQYNDIILIGHIQEHYLNITHQTLEIYRSAFAYARRLSHVMKCDDDSYINVSRLLHLLAEHQLNHTFLGAANQGYRPDRHPNSKWHVSTEEWAEDQSNITWANGPGYVLSADMAYQLAAGAAVQCMPDRLFKLEDIATGIWLTCLSREQGWRLRVVKASGFNFLGCAAGDIVSHYRSPTQMDCMFARNGDCC